MTQWGTSNGSGSKHAWRSLPHCKHVHFVNFLTSYNRFGIYLLIFCLSVLKCLSRLLKFLTFSNFSLSNDVKTRCSFAQFCPLPLSYIRSLRDVFPAQIICFCFWNFVILFSFCLLLVRLHHLQMSHVAVPYCRSLFSSACVCDNF